MMSGFVSTGTNCAANLLIHGGEAFLTSDLGGWLSLPQRRLGRDERPRPGRGGLGDRVLTYWRRVRAKKSVSKVSFGTRPLTAPVWQIGHITLSNSSRICHTVPMDLVINHLPRLEINIQKPTPWPGKAMPGSMVQCNCKRSGAGSLAHASPKVTVSRPRLR